MLSTLFVGMASRTSNSKLDYFITLRKIIKISHFKEGSFFIKLATTTTTTTTKRRVRFWPQFPFTRVNIFIKFFSM